MFVKKRVNDIKNIYDPDCWKNCPRNKIPADTWLRKCENRYPLFIVDIEQEMHLKVRQNEAEAMVLKSKLETLLDIEKFNKYYENYMYSKISFNAGNPQIENICPLSTKELDLSRKYLIKITQKEHFTEKYSVLMQEKPVPVNSVIRSFNPILMNQKLSWLVDYYKRLIFTTTEFLLVYYLVYLI